MDPAEYKHVALGLLFLKYIEDAFGERREALRHEVADPASEYYVEDPEERAEELAELLEDRDEYLAEQAEHVVRLQVPLSAYLAVLDDLNRDELVILRTRLEERLAS